jgi:hypothetical protein
MVKIMMKRTLLVTSAALLVVLGSGSIWLFAAPPPAQPFVIPYRGYIEQSGMPFNGTASLVFTYYPDALSMTTIGQPETHSAIVSGGRFSVLLGSDGATLPPNLFDQGNVFVGVSVNNTPLTGRQQLLPVPFAIRSNGAYQSATDFVVNGTLTSGAITASSLSTSGQVNAGGITITNVLSTGATAGGGGSRAINFVQDPGDEPNAGRIVYRGFGPTLAIIGAGPGNSRDVTLFDNAHVTGQLTVNASSGNWYYTNANTGGPTPDDNAGYLGSGYMDTPGYAHIDPSICPNNTVVKGVRLVRPSNVGNRLAVAVLCTD